MTRSIVSDSTTLIILGRIERYDLLENLFDTVYIPSDVMREVSQKSDGISNTILAHTLFEIKSITDEVTLKMLDGILDSGESEAIVLAKELQCILLIDEKKGRTIAKTMGLDIIGLLGVLILNAKREAITRAEAIEILNTIKHEKFRVSKKLEEHFLDVIKQ